MDFHIAYYLGRLSLEHPKDRFHIVSKDRRYDPLVKHLGTLGIDAARCAALADVPRPKADPAKRQVPSLNAVRQALVDAHNTRPRQTVTLRDWIDTRFNKTLTDAAFRTLLDGLPRRGLVAVAADKVTYSLQSDSAADG